MTALEMKVNALVLIAIGTPEEQEQGRDTLRQLLDGLIPAPVLEDTAAELLVELGFPEGNLGFEQARTALVMGYQNPRLFDSMSGELFHSIGAACNMDPSRIAQNIRTGIASMYREGNERKLDEFFRGAISAKTGFPPAGAFLRRCLRELRSRMEVAVC